MPDKGSLTVKLKPEPYLPPGAGPYRDSLLAVLESVPEQDRIGFALAYALDWLEILAANAVSPTEKRCCAALVDVCMPHVPIEIREMMAAAKKNKR